MAFFNINRVETGNRIRKHRLEMNLSQEKPASLLSEMGVEISPVSIGKWERGECNITEAHARALCEVFGCKLSELVVARLSYYDDERDQLALLIIIYFRLSANSWGKQNPKSKQCYWGESSGIIF
jgi:transcriptional regulator with XRE-family HTH domain